MSYIPRGKERESSEVSTSSVTDLGTAPNRLLRLFWPLQVLNPVTDVAFGAEPIATLFHPYHKSWKAPLPSHHRSSKAKNYTLRQYQSTTMSRIKTGFASEVHSQVILESKRDRGHTAVLVSASRVSQSCLQQPSASSYF